MMLCVIQQQNFILNNKSNKNERNKVLPAIVDNLSDKTHTYHFTLLKFDANRLI